VARRTLRGGEALCVSLLGLFALACGPPAKPSLETEEDYGDLKTRLAAKRKELVEGVSRSAASAHSESARPKSSPRRASQELRKRLSKRSREPEPEPAVEEDFLQQTPEPPGKPSFPSHLSRRERLSLACFRDDFNVTEESHMQFRLPQELEFCRCMVDAVFDARVPARLQDVLIEDFVEHRSQVEAAVPAFKQRWRSRCPM